MVQKESVGIFGGGNGKKVAAQLGHYEVPESIPVLGPDGNVLKNTFKKCYKSGAVFEGYYCLHLLRCGITSPS